MQQHNPELISLVTRWAISPSYFREAIAVRLDYVTYVTAETEENQRQHHLLTPEQALAFANDLIKAVTALGIN